jgi:protein involved in polysaccharide export with SLBB domain
MRIFALVAAALSLASANDTAHEPLKLKTGDTVSVTSPYGGDFKIMQDGAIYGRGFGRLVLEGKTWEQAQKDLRVALHKYVRDDEVNLTLKELHRDLVYLVGMNGGKGPVELGSNLSLRQLLSAAPLDDNADLVDVQVFRGGAKVCSCNAAKLLAGDSADQILQSDDVVTLAPVAFVRVWVTGLVGKPGQIRVPAGTDVYRAIAEAGGIHSTDSQGQITLQQEARVVVRRGPQTLDVPSKTEGNAITLEPGDTISVLAPEVRHITIAGEIQKPGEVVMRDEHSLTGAIAMAGGCGPEGTLGNVLILRKGEMYQIDATPPPSGKKLADFQLDSGDLIYVQRNVRAFVVLGEISRPGRIFMKDGKQYRLSDALAEAGGLTNRGSFRRVFVSHPDASGKIMVTAFNLDEYLKDGKLASNPEIQPGECILFGQPKGFTLASATQVLSGALLFESVTGAGR